MSYTYLDFLSLLGIGGAHPGGLPLTKYILSKENIDETMSVLDAGCGTGQTSAFIAEQYRCNVTSLDYNNVMLDKARKRFSLLQLPINLKYGSLENLPFDDGTFDLVLSESVTSFTNAALTIPEFKRVLKPNGVLIAIEMVLEKRLSDDELEPIIDFYGVHRLITESEWYNYFQKSNFREINVEKFRIGMVENNDEYDPEFSPSENLDQKLFEIIFKHEHFNNKYKDILGFRIFKCRV